MTLRERDADAGHFSGECRGGRDRGNILELRFTDVADRDRQILGGRRFSDSGDDDVVSAIATELLVPSVMSLMEEFEAIPNIGRVV